MKAKSENYTPAEAQRRFEAALRGSREVGPKPMKPPAKKAPKTDGDGRRAGRRQGE